MLNLTRTELEHLAVGEVDETLRQKAQKATETPSEPIPGQTGIFDQLEAQWGRE